MKIEWESFCTWGSGMASLAPNQISCKFALSATWMCATLTDRSHNSRDYVPLPLLEWALAQWAIHSHPLDLGNYLEAWKQENLNCDTGWLWHVIKIIAHFWEASIEGKECRNASGPLFWMPARWRCFGAQDCQVLNPSESQKLIQPSQ